MKFCCKLNDDATLELISEPHLHRNADLFVDGRIGESGLLNSRAVSRVAFCSRNFPNPCNLVIWEAKKAASAF